MKTILTFVSAVFMAAHLLAQSNQPVRLALIVETSEASAAGDVLTAELTKNQNIHLLERTEVEKIYREQGLSAGNKDYLKLGQILGADGLWVFELNKATLQTNLMARLIAVKPGAVLLDESFTWPLPDLTGWSPLVVKHLNDFLPKLTVLVKDAIPISVVNLRSAVQTAEALETEKQLKVLTIQRLSREKQLFVLERQRMQLLNEEKELKADDSAFWNGSYLLEGVADQNGYSKETITINARLTPPKGGTAIPIEVRGSRTNLAEVINELTMKVNEALKVASTMKEWNSADEAQQYFEEAKWALKWGVLSEAQSAADSAWALGKHDIECATVRIRAYFSQVPVVLPNNIGVIDNGWYVHIGDTPDSKFCDIVLNSLRWYYDFSRTSAGDDPEAVSQGLVWSDLRNSDWYPLGIDGLKAASQVLQHYVSNPEWQRPVADKLAQIRLLSRSVADLISKSKSVHDSYFVGDRIATHDELAHTIGEMNNIFRCEVNWGCLWQETPEDCLSFYRELLSSPVFCYMHEDLWFREPMLPRIIAWNDGDRRRIPTLWNQFVQNLNDSTNLLERLEAKALMLADANALAMSEQRIDMAFTNLFETISENHGLLASNNVDLFYLNWGTDALVPTSEGRAILVSDKPIRDAKRILQAGLSAAAEKRAERFKSEFSPKLEAISRQYWSTITQTRAANNNLAAFEKQKQYLRDHQPFVANEFARLFLMGFKNYSKAQALEIQPLLGAYKSNLVAHATEMPAGQKYNPVLQSATFYLGQAEANVSSILNPPQQKPEVSIVRDSNPPLVNVSRPPTVSSIPTSISLANLAIATNVLQVTNILNIPLGQLNLTDLRDLKINSIRSSDRTLLLDLRFTATSHNDSQLVTPVTGNDGEQVVPMKIVGGTPRVVIAVFDTVNGKWEMVPFPEDFSNGYGAFRLTEWNRSGLYVEMFESNLFLSDGNKVKRYDFHSLRWETLNLPIQNNTQIFVVNGRLYAANNESIHEITDGGKGTRILAGTRRRPVASVLDSVTSLSSPFLFSGINHSLCATIGKKVYRWDGNDWQESFTLNFSQPPEVFEDVVIFRSVLSSRPANLWVLNKDQSGPELYLHDQPKPDPRSANYSIYQPQESVVQSVWKSPAGDSLASSGAIFFRSNFYFFVDHAVATNVSGQWTVAERNGYHAKLVCLSREFPKPFFVPLQFDLRLGKPPLKSLGEKIAQADWLARPTLMFVSADTLYFHQGDKTAIWTMPISKVEAAIASQKQTVLSQRIKIRDELFAKYDHNKNLAIDTEEKEEALDNPAFIESQLDKIDTNRNGYLDPAELVYFDPNRTKILDKNELSGIELAQHFLAEEFIDGFDVTRDGLLDRSEFQGFLRAGLSGNTVSSRDSVFQFVDTDHNGQVNTGEIESFLRQQTLVELVKELKSPQIFDQVRNSTTKPIELEQAFKSSIEAYWQNPGGGRTRSNGVTPDVRDTQNEISNDKTP